LAASHAALTTDAVAILVHEALHHDLRVDEVENGVFDALGKVHVWAEPRAHLGDVRQLRLHAVWQRLDGVWDV
jgi:hypothetical protein